MAQGTGPIRAALTVDALARLASMQLRARLMVEGHLSGQHASHLRGASVEFADHREYSPGDDTRHLDWRLYARSERDFIKQFDAETNLCLYLLLDISASMAYPEQGPSKLTYASYLAAGLAYLAWRQHDAPGLALLDSQVRQNLPPRAHRGHLNRLMDALEALAPGEMTDLPAALGQAAAAMTRRGLVVLLSDLWADPEPLVRGLRHLRHRGHDVVVLHVLHPDELRFPFRGSWAFVDPESPARVPADATAVRAAYRRAFDEHVGLLRKRLRAHDLDYQLCDTSQPFDLALATVIARRARLR